MFHEKGLKQSTLDMSRAITSLTEELQAIDWYSQRIEVCEDKELKIILQHNMNEEKEHAAMLLNWIAKHDGIFASELIGNLSFIKPAPSKEPTSIVSKGCLKCGATTFSGPGNGICFDCNKRRSKR